MLETETAVLQREHPDKTIRNSPKAASSRSRARASGPAPGTLSDWIKQQKRDGGRY